MHQQNNKTTKQQNNKQQTNEERKKKKHTHTHSAKNFSYFLTFLIIILL